MFSPFMDVYRGSQARVFFVLFYISNGFMRDGLSTPRNPVI